MENTLFEIKTDLSCKSDIQILYCGKRINTKNHIYGPEKRNHYLLVLVNEGEAVLYGEKEQILKPHDLLVMHPGETICYKAKTPWSIQWVGLNGDIICEYIEKLGIKKSNPVIHVGLYNEVEFIMDKLYRTVKNNTSSSKIWQLGLIFNLFAVLFECNEHKAGQDYVKYVVEKINSDFDNDISIEKMAENLHITPAYLTRKFKQEMCVSPKQYLLNKRIEYAKELLENTDATVFEIASLAGFSDQLYFSRIFKKKENMTPTEYRQTKKWM